MKKFRRFENNNSNSLIFLFLVYLIIIGFKTNWSFNKEVVQEEPIQINTFDELPNYTASHKGLIVSAKELDRLHSVEKY